MQHRENGQQGFVIQNLEICDFESMQRISNQDIIGMSRSGENKRILQFISKKMKIESRYWVHENQDALDLSRQALQRLIAKDKSLLEEAEFFILAGISNPMPTVCTSALLAGEFGFKQASCWDIKSGCSTGVLALIQAQSWFQKGAKRGVILCAETFSKFTNKDILQMAFSVGDGACALDLKVDDNVEILGSVHGTDSRFLKTMYVPGKFPVPKNANELDYTFHFSDKADTLQVLESYWKTSLEDILTISGIKGEAVDHYIAHQIDGSKNLALAQSQGIKEESTALNFTQYGNMGCPTIFINQYFWQKSGHKWSPGETLVFHAVGGGFSWAAYAMRKK